MRYSCLLPVVLCLTFFPATQLQTARAALTWSGDLSPVDPTTWTGSTYGYIGKTADGMLAVDGGSYLYTGGGCIGYGPGTTGIVCLSGAGTKWTSEFELLVGLFGAGTLTVSDGGTVDNWFGYLGFYPGSMGSVTIDGVGSTWTHTYDAMIGGAGDATLTINGGGSVSNGYGYLGYYTGSSGAATVSGVGSTWNNAFDINVGYSGRGALAVTDGGSVSSLVGYIGYGSSSAGDVVVSGTGSIWTTSERLYVGYKANATLRISDGATVRNGPSSGTGSGYAYIGHDPGTVGEVTVTGSGSRWTTSRSLTVGYDGRGTLSITGGATVQSQGGIIASGSGSTGDVIVSGVGSLWSGGPTVGGSGTATLSITDGAVVNGGALIAGTAGSNGTVIVRGAGSKWTRSGDFSVGWSGNATLTILDGGNVTSTSLHPSSSGFSYIARRAESVSSVTVSGLDSTWITPSALHVGFDGRGTLAVDGGASVKSMHGYIGSNSNSTGLVTVSGDGSTWINSGDLYVGNYGNGTLVIADGATVTNGKGHLGSYSGSTAAVTVSGASSTWSNGGELRIGYRAMATLAITDGASLFSDAAYIDHTSHATIGGTDSKWISSGNMYVGYTGGGSLSIAGGALVTVADTTYVGYLSPFTGTLAFGPGGGTLTTRSLGASPIDLSGAGTINTRGLVSDTDLVFRSTASLTQTLRLATNPDQNIVINLDMSDPEDVGFLGAGYAGSGSLQIKDGTTVRSSLGDIAMQRGSTGTAHVTGTGSTWLISGELRVGVGGSGTLTVGSGGTVGSESGRIGAGLGSAGTVAVVGADSAWINSSNLVVGDLGGGTLTIMNDGAVSSGSTSIGYDYRASGVMTVAGAASTCDAGQELVVGRMGAGGLVITNGGTVRNDIGYVALMSGSSGAVVVTGAGATWTNTGLLRVGSSGKATLAVADGGVVTAANVSINDKSLLAIEVGNDSRIVLDGGSGAIANHGTVRLIAGARSRAGEVLTPIGAGTWSGSGSYQGIGGTWSAESHAFTSSAVENGASGMPVSINLANVQRVLVRDLTTGTSVGASFLAQTVSTPLDFTATAISGTVLNDLEVLLDSDVAILAAWQFMATGGYTPGDPAYLSFNIGPGQSRENLQCWHHDGVDWTQYDAWDVTYDGVYAAFTVNDLVGYAVTEAKAVRIPGDANGDNKVDDADAKLLAANWGHSGGWAQGDFNNDGLINALDAAILAANWGYSSTEARNMPIPEPGAVAVFFIGALGLLTRSGRFSRRLPSA